MRPNVNWNIGVATEKHSAYASKVVKAGIPFASQVTEPDTKYIIKYDFDLDDDFTMPDNCILEFDGGSINGNYTVNLNSATVLGGKSVLNCKIINPKNKRISLSWLGVGSSENDVEVNTGILTYLATKDIDWIVDVNTIYVNSMITIPYRINIYSDVYDRENQPVFYFNNSAGLLFTSAYQNGRTTLKNFKIFAKGNTIEFTGYAYDMYIENLSIHSDGGNSVTFARNFQVHLVDCWFSAPNGYAVDNLLGTTSSITRCSCGVCLACYHNCQTTWLSCNGVWETDLRGNRGKTKNWYVYDGGAQYALRLKLINCNIESIAEIPIFARNETNNVVLYIDGIFSTIYTYKTNDSGEIDPTGTRKYPAVSASSIGGIEGIAFSGGLDSFAEGVYIIEREREIDTQFYPLYKLDITGVNFLQIKAGSSVGEFSTNIVNLKTTQRPSNPLKWFKYYDITLNKLIIWDGTNWVDATGQIV